MHSVSIHTLESFFQNDNEQRALAEKNLKEFAEINPNESLEFYISALEFNDLKVSF